MNKAAEVCGGPYDILDRSGEVVGGMATDYGNSVMVQSGIKRTLIVQCGD